MADIELVIKIPSYDKEWITNGYYIPEEINMRISEAIANGTPLPKGHGKLKDENDFEKRIAILTHSMDLGYGEIMDVIDEIPTIIEADKEYEVEIITRGNCMMCGKELVDGLFFCKECENKANGRWKDIKRKVRNEQTTNESIKTDKELL